MEYAPVVVFAYNRKDKLEMCLNAVCKCAESKSSDLYLFCDGSKNSSDFDGVDAVRKYIDYFSSNSPFLHTYVRENEINLGLARNIISGVTEVINKYGKVIVLEDDIIVAEDFLDYMNRGLEFYEKHEQYGSINSCSYPIKALRKYDKDIYVTRKADCWGWGTWKNIWNDTDWDVLDFKHYQKNPIERMRFELLEAGLDNMLVMQQKGKTSSWAVRWVYSLYKRGLLSVYPSKSRAYNCGHDGSGEHGNSLDIFKGEVSTINDTCCFELLSANRKIEWDSSFYMRKYLVINMLSTINNKIDLMKKTLISKRNKI